MTDGEKVPKRPMTSGRSVRRARRAPAGARRCRRNREPAWPCSPKEKRWPDDRLPAWRAQHRAGAETHDHQHQTVYQGREEARWMKAERRARFVHEHLEIVVMPPGRANNQHVTARLTDRCRYPCGTHCTKRRRGRGEYPSSSRPTRSRSPMEKVKSR